MSKFLKNVMYVFVLAALVAGVSSCKKDDDSTTPATTTGTVVGTVTDEAGNPIEGVKVASTASGEAEQSATTGADGKYSIASVTLKAHAISFSKTGWRSSSKSITATSFTGDPKVATVDASLVNAEAKIMGTVTDAKNDNAPLKGVKVSVEGGEATTGDDGKYLIENLVAGTYSVKFELANYSTVTKSIALADFVANVATVDATMGANEPLRGLTAEVLKTAPKWYYNEYRGGRNADSSYPHFDWACNYMSVLEFTGAWEEQNEGTTLQIRNDETNGDRANPADLDVFDSFVYGRKLITEDNKIMSLNVRTHSASDDAKTTWGVQIIDLTAAEPSSVKIGDNIETNSEPYVDYDFDLSNYVGKEVVVAIGTYRAATGDYYKQLVLRAIRFADVKVSGSDWIPGEEVVEGWKLSKANAASTMVHDKGEFTGLTSLAGGDRGSYVNQYRSWRDNNHVGAEWSFVPLKKDPEVFPTEGYLIKTQNSNDVSTTVPHAYLYAKFAIAAGSNQLTFSTRTFGSNFTYFKISAVENDGTVTAVEPKSNTAVEAAAATDGLWKFKNDRGTKDIPTEYATFVYDLSAFNGKDVIITIGVYNVEENTGENKLVFHTISLD